MFYHSEFLSLMKLLKWPLTASLSDHVILAWESVQEKMTQLIMLMIQMEQQTDPHRSVVLLHRTGEVFLLYSYLIFLQETFCYQCQW